MTFDIINPVSFVSGADFCYIYAIDKHFQNCIYLQRIVKISTPKKIAYTSGDINTSTKFVFLNIKEKSTLKNLTLPPLITRADITSK